MKILIWVLAGLTFATANMTNIYGDLIRDTDTQVTPHPEGQCFRKGVPSSCEGAPKTRNDQEASYYCYCGSETICSCPPGEWVPKGNTHCISAWGTMGFDIVCAGGSMTYKDSYIQHSGNITCTTTSPRNNDRGRYRQCTNWDITSESCFDMFLDCRKM